MHTVHNSHRPDRWINNASPILCTYTSGVLCNHKKEHYLAFRKMHWKWRSLYEAKQAKLRNINIANFLLTGMIKFIINRTQGRNSRQEPGSRSWSRDHGGMMVPGLPSVACSGCFLMYPRTACPGEVPPTVGWTFPHQSLIKNMSHGLAYRSVWWMHFFCFSGTSTSLYQIGKKKKNPNQHKGMSMIKVCGM